MAQFYRCGHVSVSANVSGVDCWYWQKDADNNRYFLIKGLPTWKKYYFNPIQCTINDVAYNAAACHSGTGFFVLLLNLTFCNLHSNIISLQITKIHKIILISL